MVANREIALGIEHHMITALVVTTLREFFHNAFVEMDNNKVLHVELDYFEPYLCCCKFFSLEHDAGSYSYQPPPTHPLIAQQAMLPTIYVELEAPAPQVYVEPTRSQTSRATPPIP